jgi:hypothetical protein
MLFAPAIGAKCSIHTAWKAKHLAEHQMIGLHGTQVMEKQMVGERI